MRKGFLALAAALTTFQAGAAAGQRAGLPSFEDVLTAWDRGAYVEALEGLKPLLPLADEARFEAIALLTGELYETTAVTADGRNPSFVAATGLVMYETGPASESRIRIVDPAAGNRLVAEFPGRGAVAGRDGRRVAYLADGDVPAWRDIAGGAEQRADVPDLRVTSPPVWSANGSALYFGATTAGDDAAHGIHAVTLDGGAVRLVAATPVAPQSLRLTAAPQGVIYSTRRTRRDPPVHGAVNLDTGEAAAIAGAVSDIALSGDGRTIAYVARDGAAWTLFVHPWNAPGGAVLSSEDPLDNPALSHDGARAAFQQMPREDWEIFVFDRATGASTRLTREIQHDALPLFLDNRTVLAVKGEGRHRRSYVYDVETGGGRRLFHNNTVRTIAPEYAWAAGAGGARVLIGADRDGDTVSPERGVYLVDRTRRVSREALDARLAAMLASERALRALAEDLTKPHAADIRAITGDVSISRIFGYEKDLFAFDSKHISKPGNLKASAYLHATYASFGYSPEYQWFSPAQALGGRTANVLATLKGTVHPEVIYVISSHYDSTAAGPGAADNTSGTAVLLETARVLANRPQPATIVFASLTGEEAGLLGSEEFARRTAEAGWQVAGALNNDMIGWTNDHRLDDTIRYSNAGIRDVQHAAAMTFTDLVTYDSRYYQRTDAQAFFDAWGDIIGGIGSYPVLGNPHYHQPHDVLETINHRLVAEVAKTTAASIVMLANRPARVRGAKALASADGVAVTWQPSPERDIDHYVVAWTGGDGGARHIEAGSPAATLPREAVGSEITIVAVNSRGLESWDRARVRAR